MLDSSKHIIGIIRETDIIRVDIFFKEASVAYEQGRISWERIKQTLLNLTPKEN